MENPIDIPFTLYIWLAVGAALGWIFSFMPGPEGPVAAIESIAVGAFGASLGGEVVSAMMRGGKATGFSIGALAAAVACGILMLVMLRMMRTAVGPLQGRKKKGRRSS